MHVVSTVKTLGAIRSVLVPLGLWEPPELRSVRAPRAPPSTVRWMVDALDGVVIDLEPEIEKGLMPDSRRFNPHHERNRSYRSSEIGRCRLKLSTDPEAAIKQTAETIQIDNNLLLVLDDIDSFPCDSEPVFWTD